MTAEQQAVDVQAVIDALTEQQRYVWVCAVQWQDMDNEIALYNSRGSAIADVKNEVFNAAERDDITDEQGDEMLGQLDELAASAPLSGGGAHVDGFVYVDIYRRRVL